MYVFWKSYNSVADTYFHRIISEMVYHMLKGVSNMLWARHTYMCIIWSLKIMQYIHSNKIGVFQVVFTCSKRRQLIELGKKFRIKGSVLLMVWAGTVFSSLIWKMSGFELSSLHCNTWGFCQHNFSLGFFFELFSHHSCRSQAFYKPLDESKAIPAAELKAIFVNWKELIHCNRKLVK